VCCNRTLGVLASRTITPVPRGRKGFNMSRETFKCPKVETTTLGFRLQQSLKIFRGAYLTRRALRSWTGKCLGISFRSGPWLLMMPK